MEFLFFCFYLQKIFVNEWNFFLERIGRNETTLDLELQENSSDPLRNCVSDVTSHYDEFFEFHFWSKLQ